MAPRQSLVVHTDKNNHTTPSTALGLIPQLPSPKKTNTSPALLSLRSFNLAFGLLALDSSEPVRGKDKLCFSCYSVFLTLASGTTQQHLGHRLLSTPNFRLDTLKETSSGGRLREKGIITTTATKPTPQAGATFSQTFAAVHRFFFFFICYKGNGDGLVFLLGRKQERRRACMEFLLLLPGIYGWRSHSFVMT